MATADVFCSQRRPFGIGDEVWLTDLFFGEPQATGPDDPELRGSRERGIVIAHDSPDGRGHVWVRRLSLSWSGKGFWWCRPGTPLLALRLSPRIERALERAGVGSALELVQLQQAGTLRSLRGVGAKAARHVGWALGEHYAREAVMRAPELA